MGARVAELHQPSVWLVPIDEVGMLWSQLAPFYERALEHALDTRTDLLEIMRRLNKGQYQAGVVTIGDQIHAAFVLEVGDQPEGRILAVSLIGGVNMYRWFDQIFQFVVEVAKRIGAARIRVAGRPGWSRVLGDSFKPRAIVNEAKVSEL